MNTRRVAVIGGNRIPFARSNGPYAHASDIDMLTATLDCAAWWLTDCGRTASSTLRTASRSRRSASNS